MDDDRNMLVQLMIDFEQFLQNEAKKLEYNKEELQSLIVRLASGTR